MKKTDYGSLTMLLAMENPIIRQGLQNAFQHEGFPRAEEAVSHDKLLAMLVDASFDILITSTELTGQFVPPYIARLRQGDLGHHPLPIVIELLTSSEGDYVRKVIDSGPDDLLQLPVSPGQLINRLKVIGETRKPFVVTSDYVGPDRRQALRPGTTPIPLIEVPNPILARTKRLPEEAYSQEIATCADKLRQMRLERYSFELQWLLRAIRQLHQPEQNDAEKLQTFCERIKTLMINLPRLLSDKERSKINPQCERLILGANIVLKNGFSADATVLQGLGNLINTLTQAVLATVSPEILQAAGHAAAATPK